MATKPKAQSKAGAKAKAKPSKSDIANDDIGVEIIKFPESLIDRIHRRRILGPREDRIVDIR